MAGHCLSACSTEQGPNGTRRHALCMQVYCGRACMWAVGLRLCCWASGATREIKALALLAAHTQLWGQAHWEAALSQNAENLLPCWGGAAGHAHPPPTARVATLRDSSPELSWCVHSTGQHHSPAHLPNPKATLRPGLGLETSDFFWSYLLDTLDTIHLSSRTQTAPAGALTPLYR